MGVAVMLESAMVASGGGLPALQMLRFDETYADFRPSEGRLLEELKQFPLAGGFPKLSIGGEARIRYTATGNPDFGTSEEDYDGFWLQRLALHTEVRFHPRLRAFLQLNSAMAEGNAVGPSPVDENELELQNAFVDIELEPARPGSFLFRLGRQEMNYGSGRLINVREGPNVRRTFNAIRADWGVAAATVSAFVARPLSPSRGVFDDKPDDDAGLWGFYASYPAVRDWPGNMDIYLLGYDDRAPTFVQAVRNEHRLSLGTRVAGSWSRWDWDWEAVIQRGQTSRGDIHAWTLATQSGYAFGDSPTAPRLGLSVNVASGDKNPDDSTLQTFNAMFPRGNYFSEAAVVGPSNFYNAQLFIGNVPAPQWQTELAVNWFWRLETQDGVYTPSGSILRMPEGSDERFVGTAVSLTATRTWGRYFDATAIYTMFSPGEFIEQSGSAKTIHFIELTARFRF